MKLSRIMAAAAALLSIASQALALSVSSPPAPFPMTWGQNAGSSYIRNIPTASQIGIQAGAASLNDGFPPLTFSPISAGGVPPFGQDWNGILRQITANIQWVNVGEPATWSSSLSASIGGYPQGAIVQSATTPGTFWRSTADANTSNPDTGGAGWAAWNFVPAVGGNAATASALQTVRSISATGDASWSVSFNGSSNVTGALSLATVNSSPGTYGDTSGLSVPRVTVNGKGLVTGGGATAIPTFAGDGAGNTKGLVPAPAVGDKPHVLVGGGSFAPVGALAWAVFSGTGCAPNCTILASYNVASVTQTSAGHVVVTFDSATHDGNYAVLGTSSGANDVMTLDSGVTPSTTSFGLYAQCGNGNSGTCLGFGPRNSVVVFGN